MREYVWTVVLPTKDGKAFWVPKHEAEDQLNEKDDEIERLRQILLSKSR